MTRTCRPEARARALPLIPVLVLGVLGAALPAAAQDADHLILSEFVTTVQRSGARFIEIVNPTGADVPLDDVCLTTGTYVPNGAGYWRIVEDVVTSAVAGGGTGGTFHGRFPAGAVIAAGDTIAVSVTGSGLYQAAYGRLPDFEVFEEGAAPDAVPELVEVFPGSINAGTLAGGTNGVTLGSIAGSVVLYRWDGASELVQDLDYICYGINAAYRVDKTGYTSGASTYLADTPTASQAAQAASIADGRSYQRNSAGEGTEAAPGNGATGHDETSEVFTATWGVVTPQTPPAPPAAWLPTAPIFGAATVSPQVPYDGQPAVITLQLASASALTSVQVSYTVDGGAVQTVAAAVAGGGAWTATIPGQAEGAVVRWWAEAVNADGVAAVHPAAAPRFTSGWTTDEAPPVCVGKLLLTEICTLGTAQEFIEIWNPFDVDVDLSDYYLTDAVYSPNNTGYWNIGGGILNSDTIGGGGPNPYYDFHARFPDGFTIAANDTIVISVAGSNAFAGEFQFLPDLELYEDDPFPDEVPDMRWVFGTAGDNSIISPASTPGLTNNGEVVVLYHYVEGEDLVSDVDIFFWGTGTSYRFAKGGTTIGGSTFLPETIVDNQRPYTTAAEFGSSYQRVDAEESTQVPNNSNGICGSDELSENLPAAFTLAPWDPSRPATGPGPEPGAGAVALKVPAKTFLPVLGESFPVQFTSRPRSETRLRLFDQSGRLVITLYDSRFESPPATVPGSYTTVYWDGSDDTYQRVPAGMYILHLSVVEEATGDEETRTAPVVVATRLSK